MRRALQAVVEAVFRVLFSYDCRGEELLPAEGPAIVAANHPSYLDPVALSLQVARPIHFLAWDALFRVPLLGPLIRLFGAIPVDVRPGAGGSAYATARQLLEEGRLVGIFPEGKRSSHGWMEPRLREGAARLALETGAPLYPATIAGAFRAWPKTQVLPNPARVHVRYHEPIDPKAYAHLPEEEAMEALLAELRRRVDRTLLPGTKRDTRIAALYRSAGPWPRPHEWLPALALAVLLFWRERSVPLVWPCYAYIAYLFADHLLLPQRRWVKRLRNASPVLFLLGYAPVVLDVFGLPQPVAGGALLAVLAGAGFPYLYERAWTALDFVRGLCLALVLELVALHFAPAVAGPHVALALYAASFAWLRRTVFWRWSTGILLAYAAGIGWWLAGDAPLLAHVTVGPLAVVLVAFSTYRAAPSEPAQRTGEAIVRLGLDD